MTSGPTMFTAAIKSGKQPIRPSGDRETAGRLLAKDEARRLAAAELFWVDEQMTDLVLGSAGSMPSYNLLPEDLPSRAGLIVFAKPIQRMPAHDDFADSIYVRAAAWGPITGESPWDLWISWYTDTALNWGTVDPKRLALAFGVPLSKVGALPTWRQMGLPALSYENEHQVCFSEKPIPLVSATTGEVVDGFDYPYKELATAWTLMQQPITRSTPTPCDRSTRRRLERENIKADPVRVITLRRTRPADEHTNADRDYHHQWIVRGHWRQQWYPSREVHRPIWIAPHVKGPEGAPLLGGEKVYAWRR